MAQKRKPTNSNLFSIDFDAIERILEEANASLISAADEILERVSDFPTEIQTPEHAAEAKELLSQLKAQARDVSQARLSDGRPFTDATKLVKQWFNSTEQALQLADKQLANALSSYIKKQNEEIDATRRRNEEKLGLPEPPVKKDIGHGYNGDPIVNVWSDERDSGEVELETAPKPVGIDLIWEVEGFDRDTLPLEALRPYFTDFAILNALRLHLKENGPNELQGVEYSQQLPKKL